MMKCMPISAIALALALLAAAPAAVLSGPSPNEGEVSSGAIEGYVFQDDDGDGILDPEEYGVMAVTVRLVGDGTESSVLTDSSGLYRFEDLPEGTYDILVEPGMVWSIVGRSVFEGVTIEDEELSGLDFGIRPVTAPEPETVALPESTEGGAATGPEAEDREAEAVVTETLEGGLTDEGRQPEYATRDNDTGAEESEETDREGPTETPVPGMRDAVNGLVELFTEPDETATPLATATPRPSSTPEPTLMLPATGEPTEEPAPTQELIATDVVSPGQLGAAATAQPAPAWSAAAAMPEAGVADMAGGDLLLAAVCLAGLGVAGLIWERRRP